MATFDQLSDEQRAILELVLQRGQSYPTLAGMLSMREERVRELAHDALIQLAPITAPNVEDDWRGQIADYILGQQSGPESTATRGHLRRSEQARAWAGSLLDSLETLYGERALPSIPAASRDRGRGRERDRGRRADAVADAPVRELSPEARAAVRRRRGRALAGGLAAAVLLVVVLVWPVGVLMGDDDDGGGDGGEQAASNEQPAAATGEASGLAYVADQDGKLSLVVQAVLPPSKQREAYEVWLYNSPTDAKSLGAQVTDARGGYQGVGLLPEDYTNYQFVDVSREPIDDDSKHSAKSVLRGRIGQVGERPADAQEGQPAILKRVTLRPPS